MAPEPNTSAHSSMKRPHSDSLSSSPANDVQLPAKRQRVVRRLKHVQHRPNHVELAPQDPIFAQGQLLKSIAAALFLAGFEAAKPSALEMFRAQVEEFMLEFLGHAQLSMNDGRRTRPTAMDFATALANTSHAYTASLLEPQLRLLLPQDISYPVLSHPPPAPLPAPDFGDLLQPLMTTTPPAFIPSHLPPLPPQHAWKQTPDFPKREKDARKMREKATEEGMLAEQALRKLAAAEKSGAAHNATRRSGTLSGLGRPRSSGPKKPRARVVEDTIADVLKDVDGSDEAMDLDFDMDGAREVGEVLGIPEGVSVNHEIGHFRRHGARGN